MKKILLAFIFALFIFIPGSAQAKGKINVYMFRGQGCPHCAEAEEYFKKLEKDVEYSKYYTLKDYEVWYDEKNNELMNKVAKKLKEQASGVPYIIIGKKTFNGFSESTEKEIKDAIKKEYNSKKSYDVIKELNTKKEDNSAVPIIITISVAVLIIGGLVFLTKKM